ncbi:hypothetical protein PM082_014575 [Marasmius tenuissimus]|nr:hypothetical protein PM082_014575 [Marasmius tenuissimus]
MKLPTRAPPLMNITGLKVTMNSGMTSTPLVKKTRVMIPTASTTVKVSQEPLVGMTLLNGVKPELECETSSDLDNEEEEDGEHNAPCETLASLGQGLQLNEDQDHWSGGQESRGIPQVKQPTADGALQEDFLNRLLLDYIMELIVAEDLPIRLVNSEFFCKVVLLLHKALDNKDIIHRTTLHNYIMETWLIYMHKIKDDLKNALRTVLFTTDGWSDMMIFSFIAVTAHWVDHESNSPDTGLSMRAAVISFYGLPISHTGAHLAHALANILE